MRLKATIHIDRVGMLGVIVGIASLLFPTLTLKANRVDGGVGYQLWEMPSSLSFILAIIISLIVMAGALTVLPQRRPIHLTKSAIGIAILLVCCALLVLTKPLVVPLGEAGRLSLASGLWLLAISGYILMESSLSSIALPTRWLMALRLLPAFMLIFLVTTGGLSHLAIMKEFMNNRSRLFQDLLNHLFLSFSAVTLAVIIGIPLGIIAWRRKLFERGVFTLVNGVQTIPSLALFGLIIAPLSLLSFRFPLLRSLGIKGVGNTPALIALTLYALLPIVQNTYTSLANIGRPVIDAGWGMGMNRHQMLTQIEIPLSLPILMSGIRTSLVQTIGNTTVAALIGAAGLGSFIFRGLGQASPDLIYLGVLPVIVMAITVDRLFGMVIRKISLPLHTEALS